MAVKEAVKNITDTWVLIERPNVEDCEHVKLRLDVKAVAFCEGCGGRWQHPKMHYRKVPVMP